MGIVSPVGSTVETAWANILAGRAGSDRSPLSMPAIFSASAGRWDFQVEQYLNPRKPRRWISSFIYGIGAAVQAIQDSGLEDHRSQRRASGYFHRFGNRRSAGHRGRSFGFSEGGCVG